MSVIHLLKDGSQLKDITGHIVKIEDAEPLYRFIRSINKESGKTLNTYDSSKNEVRV